jgi:selenide,water dikinase
MGGKPKLALNILCIPENLDPSITERILHGGYDKVKEAGALICGGHTIKDSEPKYGLSVTGFAHPDHILKNSGLAEGDCLILTKALGTGIINTAAKADLISIEDEKTAIESMKRLNSYACTAMLKHRVHASTDITGFGLLGHAYEMVKGSDNPDDGKRYTLIIESKDIPLLPSALDMASMGIIPKGAYGNRRWLSCHVGIEEDVPLAIADILFDPQTSGGLLFALPEQEAEACLEELLQGGHSAAIVGYVRPAEETDKKRIYVK